MPTILIDILGMFYMPVNDFQYDRMLKEAYAQAYKEGYTTKEYGNLIPPEDGNVKTDLIKDPLLSKYPGLKNCCCASGKWKVEGWGNDLSLLFGIELNTFTAKCIGKESMIATFSTLVGKIGATASGGASRKFGYIENAYDVLDLRGFTWGFEIDLAMGVDNPDRLRPVSVGDLPFLGYSYTYDKAIGSKVTAEIQEVNFSIDLTTFYKDYQKFTKFNLKSIEYGEIAGAIAYTKLISVKGCNGNEIIDMRNMEESYKILKLLDASMM